MVVFPVGPNDTPRQKTVEEKIRTFVFSTFEQG